MIETLEGSGSRTSTSGVGRRTVATSLFGGAILATIATASLAQTTPDFPTAKALSSATASGDVVESTPWGPPPGSPPRGRYVRRAAHSVRKRDDHREFHPQRLRGTSSPDETKPTAIRFRE
jgi:hypothetical protein